MVNHVLAWFSLLSAAAFAASPLVTRISKLQSCEIHEEWPAKVPHSFRRLLDAERLLAAQRLRHHRLFAASAHGGLL
jgi:hypothetical protein